MSVNTINYKGNLGSANTDRRFSDNIWADCPIASIRAGDVPGRIIDDRFEDFPLIGTQTTQIAHGKYKVFATATGSVQPVSAINSVEVGGNIMKFVTGTDNNSASLAQSYPTFMMTGLTSNSGKLWFEARVAMSSILTDTVGWFCGLAEVEQWTLATAVPFNGASATINNSASAIGFLKGEDALGVISTVYSDRATSWTNITASATSLTATYTFRKIGMTYDPTDTAKCIRFFADGLELATGMTQAALVALTNLDANALGLIFAHIVDASGTTTESYLDGWRCAQVFPN